jgi:hypothetical protein
MYVYNKFLEQSPNVTISITNSKPIITSAFNHKHINKLIDLNAKLLVDNTEYIEIVDTGTVVSEKEFIEEFYFNCDSELCKALQDKLVEIGKQGAVKPQTGTCENCSTNYDVALTFDYASFFANSS